MNRFYPIVADRAGHRCEYCRAPEAVFNFPFEVEHIVPSCRNGLDEEFNMALSCRSCNLFKSTYVTAIDTDTELEVDLFNPRRELWEHHFLFDDESFHIEGHTAIGRAAAARLQLNRPQSLAARRIWKQLGLFP